MITNDQKLAELITEIAVSAGELIMEVYGSDFEIASKADASPVTEADQRAEALILPRLADLTPDVPIVAEEQVSAGNVPNIDNGVFWLVDPLDGTREFIARNGEFTVNIALIRAGHPVLGVVHTPARGETFTASGPSFALRRIAGGKPEAITVRAAPEDGLVAMVSRSHKSAETDTFLARYPIVATRNAGSSLKFCVLAAGEADLYPRLGRTMEWDTAAGHAVLAAAGGRVTKLDGSPLTYGKPGFENPHFLARGAAPSG